MLVGTRPRSPTASTSPPLHHRAHRRRLLAPLTSRRWCARRTRAIALAPSRSRPRTLVSCRSSKRPRRAHSCAARAPSTRLGDPIALPPPPSRAALCAPVLL